MGKINKCTMTLHFISGQSLHWWLRVWVWYSRYHDITFPGNLSTKLGGLKQRIFLYHDITFPGNLSTALQREAVIKKVPWHYISGQSLHFIELLRGFRFDGYHDITFPCNLSTQINIDYDFIIGTMTLHFRAISPLRNFIYKNTWRRTMTLHFRAISSHPP